MQWSAEKNAGFSDADTTYMPVIDEAPFSYREINVAAQEADPHSFLNWTRYLIRARQAQPALRSGTLEWVETGDVAVLAFRRRDGGDEVLCVFNLSDTARPSGITPNGDLRDLLSREARVLPAGEEIELGPFAALWLAEQ